MNVHGREQPSDPLSQLREAIGYETNPATLRCGGVEPYHRYRWHRWLVVQWYARCVRCGKRRWFV